MRIEMKMALKIFRRDLRRLGRNPAALLIAAGLCLIPALYAWLNLAAGRDPYSNTQGILVAVADCDEGAANERRSLDAGRKILDNLKENEELGWVFTDEAEALEGVKAGRYYAAIVIPEDFSRELLAIEAGEIGAPEIRYYVNEKRNAVAPKITDKGADAVQEKINQSFSEEASRAVAEELQDFGAGIKREFLRDDFSVLSGVSLLEIPVRYQLSVYGDAVDKEPASFRLLFRPLSADGDAEFARFFRSEGEREILPFGFGERIVHGGGERVFPVFRIFDPVHRRHHHAVAVRFRESDLLISGVDVDAQEGVCRLGGDCGEGCKGEGDEFFHDVKSFRLV